MHIIIMGIGGEISITSRFFNRREPPERAAKPDSFVPPSNRKDVQATPLSATPLPDQAKKPEDRGVTPAREQPVVPSGITQGDPERTRPPQTEVIPAYISPPERYLAQRLLDKHKEWTKYADIPSPVREAMQRYTWAEDRQGHGTLDATAMGQLLSKLNQLNDILESKQDVQRRIADLLKQLRDNPDTIQIADRAALLFMLQTMLANSDVLSFITKHGYNDVLYLQRIFDKDGSIRRDYPRVDMSIIPIAAGINEYVSSKPPDAKWGPGSGEMLSTFKTLLDDSDRYREFFKEFGIT